MKSSTLRWSFGSIHSSGLNVPFVPSPRGIMQAIWLGRSETSNVSIFLAPLSPARSRFQVGSMPQPSGETMPRPVTTTRLIEYRSSPPDATPDNKLKDRAGHGPSIFLATPELQLFAFFSRNLVASPTVKIVSA